MKGRSSGDANHDSNGRSDESYSRNFYSSGYSSDGNSSIDINGKRKFLSVDNLDANKSKKRFVWPDSLHKDFVAAVFDVGLKSANSHILQQMLPHNKEINPETLKAALQKYRIFRDRTKYDYASYYDVWLKDLGECENQAMRGSSSSRDLKQLKAPVKPAQSAAEAAAQRQSREAAKAAAAELAFAKENSANLRKQIDVISKTISAQSVFLSTLKNSISKQSRLHSQLVHKLTLMDPSTAPNLSDIPCPEGISRSQSAPNGFVHDSYGQDNDANDSDGVPTSSISVSGTAQPHSHLLNHDGHSSIMMSDSLAQSISNALELHGKAATKGGLLGTPVPRYYGHILTQLTHPLIRDI
jgi:hypothetical protein